MIFKWGGEIFLYRKYKPLLCHDPMHWFKVFFLFISESDRWLLDLPDIWFISYSKHSSNMWSCVSFQLCQVINIQHFFKIVGYYFVVWIFFFNSKNKTKKKCSALRKLIQNIVIYGRGGVRRKMIFRENIHPLSETF